MSVLSVCKTLTNHLVCTPAPASHSLLFSKFGGVEDVNLFHQRKSGQSKGCGMVTLQARDHALAALQTYEQQGEVSTAEVTVCGFVLGGGCMCDVR